MRSIQCLLLALLSLLLSHPAAAQEPPVRQLTTGAVLDGDPSWSPDGSEIAFASYRSGGPPYLFDVWKIPAAGGIAVQLTANPDASGYPAWSPSGDLIAYAAATGFPRNWDIWTLPVAGGDHHSLTVSGSGDWHPAWSPDETQIAFSSERSGSVGNIYVMAATGEPPAATALTFGNRNLDPAWSPDGTEIAFHTQDFSSNYDIWVLPVSGGPARQLTDYPSDETDAAWSPDGTQIAFTGVSLAAAEGNPTAGFVNPDIIVVPAAGGPPTQLTTHPASDTDPAWSPDGTQIAFSSNRDGTYAIWVMDLSTVAVEPAPEVPSNIQLAVSPNPFHDTATIRVEAVSGLAMLRIVDVAGRLVRELRVPGGVSPAGAQTLVWDGRDARGRRVSRGIYYFTLEDGGLTGTARVVRAR